MAQDVNVREADVIKAYEKRFSNFGDTVAYNLRYLKDALPDFRDKMERSQKRMEQIQQTFESWLKDARNELYHLQGQQEKQYQRISQAQDKVDKLTRLCNKAAQSVETGRALMAKSRSVAEDLKDRTQRFSRDMEEHVDRGLRYLDEVVARIMDYKTA